MRARSDRVNLFGLRARCVPKAAWLRFGRPSWTAAGWHWRKLIGTTRVHVGRDNRAGGAHSNRKAACNRMNMKRMRGRSNRNGGGGGGGGGGGSPRQYGGNIPLNRNHVFDSSGPDLRIRGTAQQLFEKYLQLGRDATGSGDRVMAESYFQYAEHYFRIVNAINQAAQQSGQHQGGQQQGGQQQGGQGHQPHNGQHNGQRRERDEGAEEQAPPMANGPAPGYGDQPGMDPAMAEDGAD